MPEPITDCFNFVSPPLLFFFCFHGNGTNIWRSLYQLFCNRFHLGNERRRRFDLFSNYQRTKRYLIAPQETRRLVSQLASRNNIIPFSFTKNKVTLLSRAKYEVTSFRSAMKYLSKPVCPYSERNNPFSFSFGETE